MLKHSNIISDFEPRYENISSGERYYITNYNLKDSLNYTFDNKLINQNIQLKFTIFGLKPNENVEVIFNNGESYMINNTSLEVNYKYKNSFQNGFYFKCENIEENNLLLAEIKVGFLKEEYNNNFELKDLENVLGTNSINKNKTGFIIKIPKEFDESLYDFSIIFNYYEYLKYDVEIVYDDLQFIVPIYESKYYIGINISPIIPLFKINPYNQINEIEDNKFFYILIKSYDNSEYAQLYRNFSIKKPKVFTDTLSFNKINVIPKATDNKYYYQIKIPKEDYISLLIETIYSWRELIISLSKDKDQYPFIQSQKRRFYSYRFMINNNKEKDLYLNYYKTEYDYGYINFVDYNYSFNENNWITKSIETNVKTINGKINIQVNFTSISYYFVQETFKYYIIINAIPYKLDFDYDSLYPIIINKKKIDKSKGEFMKIIEEDKGNKEILEYSFDIDIKLKDINYIVILPVRKEKNLIELMNIMDSKFSYYEENNKYEDSTSIAEIILIIIFSCIMGPFVIIIIIHIICLIVKKMRQPSIEDMNESIFKDNEELKEK